MEGLYHSQHGAPEVGRGAVYYDNELHGAIQIPNGLSLLTRLDPHARITGLDGVPADQRPPVNVVHLAFDAMVGIGFALLALGGWVAWSWWRRRDLPATRWFLRAVAVSGVAAVVAMEAGWITTEVGRQPWIVYRLLRVDHRRQPGPWHRLGAARPDRRVRRADRGHRLRPAAHDPQPAPCRGATGIRCQRLSRSY